MKKNILLAITAGFILSACGGNSLGTVILQTAAGNAKAKLQERRKGAPAKPAELTQASLAGVKQKVMRVRVPLIGYSNVATRLSNNNGYVNWRTPSEQSFTTNGGFLTSTKGLPFDLTSAENKQGTRIYRYVVSDNSINTLTLNCTITDRSNEVITIAQKQYQTSVTEETCKGPAKAFKNKIWRDPSGAPRKAHQWVSFQSGFAILEWLN